MIEELERLLATASPRPWREVAESGDWWVEGADGIGVCDSNEPWNHQGDIDLMVAAVNVLPALLRVVRAADKALDASHDISGPDRFDLAMEELEAALYNLRSLEAGND